MKNELKLKKCSICGNVVKVYNDIKINCCNKEMIDIISNTEDCAIEKHIPTYEKVEDEIYVKVNHVMEKEHYIEWLCLVAENREYIVKLYPEQNAEARFPYIKDSTIYAYCNKHGLWKVEVK